MNERKIAIALGSNMGNRLEMLRRALKKIEESGFAVTAKSRVWETMPWGIADQRLFLNMCVTAVSALEPKEMLRRLKAIELCLGRKEGERWGPRLIDIDIILIDNEIIDEDELKVPHPRMQERAFVLVPLEEIAPGATHPKLGRTVREMLGDLAEEKMDWIIKI